MNQENAFQLHYFPEIPLERTGSCRTIQKDLTHLHGYGFVRDGGGGAWSNLSKDDTLPPALSRKSLDEIETQAYIRGFNKGEKAGFESAMDKIESLKRLLDEAVEALRHARNRIQRDTEKEIVELVLAVAGRIVGHEVQTNREAIVAVVQEALQKVENQDTVVIKMNPADVDFLDRLRLPLSSLSRNPDGLRVEADESVGIGGCLIETDGGDIDARIESRLRFVGEAFRKKLGQGLPEHETEASRGRAKE
ncbi:MAG: FliH/SctL family protein [Desulfobacterales bacterium]|nr:FliH/SctL family protein [Desulfobacterales bacterium]